MFCSPCRAGEIGGRPCAALPDYGGVVQKCSGNRTVSNMLRRLAFLVFILALGDASAVCAQGTSVAPPTGQSALAAQLDTCRQNSIQLAEQARVQQTKLVSLRAKRKTLGSSGGELARYKLANLDQELKEHSKQYQSANALAEAEKKRCDTIAAKMVTAGRGKQ